MWDFILKIITVKSGYSSKRFLALIGMVLYVAMVVCAFFGIIIPDLYIESDVFLITSLLGLGLIDKGKKKGDNGNDI